MRSAVYDLTAGYPAIIFGLFLVILILILLAGITSGGRRKSTLAKWTSKTGFSYDHTPSGGKFFIDGLLASLQVSGLLKNLTKLTLRNIMRGKFEGNECLIFDMHGWREHRYSEIQPVQWTWTVMFTGKKFPTLNVRPLVPVVSRISPEYSSTTIKTGDREFDRRFLVFGEKLEIESVLTRRLRGYLLGLALASNRWYRQLYLHNNIIAVFEPNLAPPRHIEEMMKIAADIQEHVSAPGGN